MDDARPSLMHAYPRALPLAVIEKMSLFLALVQNSLAIIPRIPRNEPSEQQFGP